MSDQKVTFKDMRSHPSPVSWLWRRVSICHFRELLKQACFCPMEAPHDKQWVKYFEKSNCGPFALQTIDSTENMPSYIMSTKSSHHYHAWTTIAFESSFSVTAIPCSWFSVRPSRVQFTKLSQALRNPNTSWNVRYYASLTFNVASLNSSGNHLQF